MGNLRSLSLFVGTGECNGKCRHCAGRPLRRYAPKTDGIVDEALIDNTMRVCYKQGARSLSISSSGEPTLSPLSISRVLEMNYDLQREGIRYSPINLYSNGIRIGSDEDFCREYLLRWRGLGLSTVYITVHNVDEKENAKLYGVSSYPKIDGIVSRVHDAGLLLRANIVLSKTTIKNFDEFVYSVSELKKKGFNSISAWPIRTLDDKADLKNSPGEEELDKMEAWSLDEGDVRLLREKSKVTYERGEKLTLFPNGILSNSWCN